MPQGEREIVSDGGTSERKSALSLKVLASVWNTKYVITSRGAESVCWSVQFKQTPSTGLRHPSFKHCRI